jgi:very-short-patch-repair endonuclease
MKNNSIIWYNPKLKELARQLRKNSTKAEVLLWIKIKGKSMGYEFHRQVPIDEFIVDFYCHELRLAIELDGAVHNYNFDFDLFRQNKLKCIGIRFIRFCNEDVYYHINDVLRAIENEISEIEKELDTK